jgi:hypothetical protein
MAENNVRRDIEGHIKAKINTAKNCFKKLA